MTGVSGIVPESSLISLAWIVLQAFPNAPLPWYYSDVSWETNLFSSHKKHVKWYKVSSSPYSLQMVNGQSLNSPVSIIQLTQIISHIHPFTPHQWKQRLIWKEQDLGSKHWRHLITTNLLLCVDKFLLLLLYTKLFFTTNFSFFNSWVYYTSNISFLSSKTLWLSQLQLVCGYKRESMCW